MKILILGNDGRAHALVWKLFSSASAEVLVAPGNGGATQLAPAVDLDPNDAAEVARWAFAEQVDLIVPAEGAPLVAGLVDEVVSMHIGVCGPAQRAAQLERSRCLARMLLERGGLPLPRGRACPDLATAEKFLAAQPLPLLIRADNPDDGDGVYHDRYAALEALRTIFADRPAGGPGVGVVVEEFLPGITVSISALTDGSASLPLLPVRLYDRLGPALDSPVAPGMGAVTGNSAYAQKLGAFLHTRVVQPVVAALAAAQMPYWGILGVDCVITEQGPRVTGLRCSLRDMEAQAVLPRLEGDLVPLIQATIARRLAQIAPPSWRDEASVAIGLVAQGYPHHFPVGGLMEGLGDLDAGVLLFHDQTHNPSGMRYTPATRGSAGLAGLFGGLGGATAGISVTGGHVATVVALGATLAGARGRALLNAERIRFPGRTYREDVGAHEFR
jgi:phosphoribosylamine--glycine ligase